MVAARTQGPGPAAVIAAPLAAPPLNGLVVCAPDITARQPDSRWENGFSFDPEGCGSSGVFDVCSSAEKPVAANPEIVEYVPFGIYGADKCSTMQPGRDWVGRARRQLLACESKQLEAELWTGDHAIANGWPNRYLASNLANTITNGPTTYANVIACLEQGLAECGCGSRGMIHVTPQLATHLTDQHLIRREGALILTALDTIVVVGSGYDGSSPDGNPASLTSQWAYATSMIYLLRGDIQILPDTLGEATDRSMNLVEYRAERVAAAFSDNCCHLAAEVDLGICPDLAGS